MTRWKVNASTLFVLSIVVLFMVVIVVHPDIDLPDTAFHRGTAPLAVHAQATTAPPVVVVATLFQFPDTAESWHVGHVFEVVTPTFDPNFRPILLRSIRR